MNIQAYMTSCPEREDVRGTTLADLAKSDWPNEARVVIDRVEFESTSSRQISTVFRMLQKILADGFPLALFLEDDLIFCRSIYSRLRTWKPLATFDGRHFFGSLYNPGIEPIAGTWSNDHFIARPTRVWGSQAFVLARDTILHIVENWDRIERVSDIRISRLAAEVTPLYYHRPSLVQHRDAPTLFRTPPHQASDFLAT
jgi:hypothetical protein